MQYNLYLRTPHWQEKRLEKLAKSPYCQICDSSRGTQVHHKRYKDVWGKSILFREKVTDLITLCSSCHRFMHVYIGIEVRKVNKKILRVRRLLQLGATKQKAFWVVSQHEEMFIAVLDGLRQQNLIQ